MVVLLLIAAWLWRTVGAASCWHPPSHGLPAECSEVRVIIIFVVVGGCVAVDCSVAMMDCWGGKLLASTLTLPTCWTQRSKGYRYFCCWWWLCCCWLQHGYDGLLGWQVVGLCSHMHLSAESSKVKMVVVDGVRSRSGGCEGWGQQIATSRARALGTAFLGLHAPSHPPDLLNTAV